MADSPSDPQDAPPLPNRRPRVREVSSRFMTPLIHSNSNPTPKPTSSPRSKSVQRRLISKTDENHPPETNRKSKDHQHSRVKVSSRPDTPVALGTDRIVPSRYNKHCSNTNTPLYRSNSLNNSSSGCSSVTAASRLLQEATTTSDVDKKLSRISTSSCDDSDACSVGSSNQGASSCPNSPLFVPLRRQRSVPDSRASMPDVDKWLAERNLSGKSTGDCARSLNLSVKVGGGASLPPHPSSNVRSGLDVKKGRGMSSHQEDVHSLKMMSNHYLQWRFANAKAEACVRARRQEAERKLYSLGAKISDIRDNVTRKRKELAMLRGINTLNTVVEAQMPYLDEWSTLGEDYSTSLSSTTNALLNSLARLPVSGNVRVDAGELQEALSSAVKVAELIGSNIQRFMQKAEEMDISTSELAKMAGGERSLIEESGFLLSKNYSSQVTECSLMGTLMQLHNINHGQPQKT